MTSSNDDLVKEWYKFAMRDWETAKYICNMRPIPFEIICYHCQQSSEKMLKGFLISNEIEPPKTHDLIELHKICAEINNAFEELYDICAFLTQYGVQPRYPNEIEILETDAKKALQSVQTIIDFFKNQSIDFRELV